MCIICVELEKNKLSPWEARKNLTEMVEKIGPEHALEVDKKISDMIFEHIAFNYGDTLHDDEKLCDSCDCSPCDCDWGY